jgi:hypothetical protein
MARSGLQPQIAGDDFLLDLGGATEDIRHAGGQPRTVRRGEVDGLPRWRDQSATLLRIIGLIAY